MTRLFNGTRFALLLDSVEVEHLVTAKEDDVLRCGVFRALRADGSCCPLDKFVVTLEVASWARAAPEVLALPFAKVSTALFELYWVDELGGRPDDIDR